MNMRLADVHNHLQDPRFGEDLPKVLREMHNEGIRLAVVNGTSENDWQKVLDLCRHHDPLLLPALGLHPWHVSARSAHWKTVLREGLESSEKSSIGECGLDLWRQPADLDDQISVLRFHLELARTMSKPLTIHCLKAWQPLLTVLKQSDPLPPFLLHSFSGPPDMIKPLIRLGAYFSLSGYFLSDRKWKTLQAFSQIPSDRILIESDAPDMAPPVELQGHYHHEEYHHPADLISCAKALAGLKNMPLEECVAMCWENTQKWLGNTIG